jgi:hypothetical protein
MTFVVAESLAFAKSSWNGSAVLPLLLAGTNVITSMRCRLIASDLATDDCMRFDRLTEHGALFRVVCPYKGAP